MSDEKKTNFGEEAHKLLSEAQPEQSVEETIDEMGKKYIEELELTVEENHSKFESPFYIVVLRKKESTTINNVRQWFVSRQTEPSPHILRDDFKNSDHDVWKIDSKNGTAQYLWTLPTHQDCVSILKSKDMHDPHLVKTIVDFYEERKDFHNKPNLTKKEIIC